MMDKNEIKAEVLEIVADAFLTFPTRDSDAAAKFCDKRAKQLRAQSTPSVSAGGLELYIRNPEPPGGFVDDECIMERSPEAEALVAAVREMFRLIDEEGYHCNAPVSGVRRAYGDFLDAHPCLGQRQSGGGNGK
jgi:hypothetical protein